MNEKTPSAKSVEVYLEVSLDSEKVRATMTKGLYQALESFSKRATNNEDVNSRRTKPI